MPSNKDYTKMTREELASESQKMKSQKTITAVVIGFLAGVAVYSATHKGFILPVILLVFAFLIGKKDKDNTQHLEAEINSRDRVD
jgi:uncharacterized membrane protein YbjE (DUF340 family)